MEPWLCLMQNNLIDAVQSVTLWSFNGIEEFAFSHLLIDYDSAHICLVYNIRFNIPIEKPEE